MENSSASSGSGSGEVAPGDVDAVARELKSTYVMFRRRLFPSYTMNDSTRWRNIWEKAARICLLNKIPPLRLVMVAFERTTPFPYPNILLNEKIVGIASSKEEDIIPRQARAKTRYEFELSELKIFSDMLGGVREALLDTSNGMSALFRYAIASRIGLHDVRDVFEGEARGQRAMEPEEYLTFYPSDCLPE